MVTYHTIVDTSLFSDLADAPKISKHEVRMSPRCHKDTRHNKSPNECKQNICVLCVVHVAEAFRGSSLQQMKNQQRSI